MKSALYETARRFAGDRFPEFLALGGDDGWAAFLGYRPGEKEPAIVLLQVDATGWAHSPQLFAHLDSSLPVGRTTCPWCRARQAGWPHSCAVCGRDLASVPDDPQADLLVPRGYQHLGALRRAEGGGPLHFLRKGPRGRVVGMAEKPAADGAVALVPLWTSTAVPVAPDRRRTAARIGGGAAVATALLIALLLVLRGPRSSAADDGSRTSLMQDGDTAGVTPSARVPDTTASRTSTDTATREVASRPPGTAPPSTGGTTRPGPATRANPAPSPTQGGVNRPGASTPATRPGRPPVTPSRPPSSLPPAPTPQGVEAAIGRYASAVGTGDTRRIAQVYPGITAAEVNRWNRFFAPLGARSGMRASYEVVSGPTLAGNRAEVIFTLNLSYTSAAGAQERDALPLRALLQWTGTGWSLQEVRLLQ